MKRLKTFFLWTGATTIDEILQKNPQLAQAIEFEKNRPMSVRAEDKGILALVAACGPTDVVGRLRSYINQWYGYRAAQCRALSRCSPGSTIPRRSHSCSMSRNGFAPRVFVRRPRFRHINWPSEGDDARRPGRTIASRRWVRL